MVSGGLSVEFRVFFRVAEQRRSEDDPKLSKHVGR